jgi:hypothetical protein
MYGIVMLLANNYAYTSTHINVALINFIGHVKMQVCGLGYTIYTVYMHERPLHCNRNEFRLHLMR